MASVRKFRPQSAGQVERVSRTKVELAANVAVRKGRPAVIDGGYYREPAAGVETLSPLRGRWTQDVDNTGGAAGAKVAEIDFYKEFQVAWLNNDTEGSPVQKADRGSQCFWAGPFTVTSAADGNSAAGEVFDVTSDGRFVAVKLEA
ncbi:uncharacterized protein SOCEGT47_056910 [Sorangium cellulosum]|uniref:Uncharacterized protein n=1 Tax=Sorangium cellulosum TaxID=56 RepID=A0A4P2Q6N1_SORCE|nr:hypothetical protein [Sorangium cellulosum]AUX25147.1 uncharacterized protein SOCEGT47_056910 [Sorangium cellulosum]